MTTATPEVDEQVLTFEVEEAPADYEPERRNPGRTRKPSQFTEVLRNAYGKGWQRVPFSNEDELTVIKREINRAQQHVDCGLDRNITDTHFEFKVRDKQERKPRKAKGEDAQSDENGVSEE